MSHLYTYRIPTLCTPCWTITWSAFVVSLTIICILRHVPTSMLGYCIPQCIQLNIGTFKRSDRIILMVEDLHPDQSSGLVSGAEVSTRQSHYGDFPGSISVIPEQASQSQSSEGYEPKPMVVSPPIQDDQAEPEDVSLSLQYPSEKTQAVLEVLKLISDAGTAGLSEEQNAVIQKALSHIGVPCGPLMLDSLKDLQGKELIDALRALNLLGDLLDNSLGLSALGTATLLTYFSYHTDQNVMRGAISVLYAMLAHDSGIKAAICRYLKCGKNRIDKGMDELAASGLNLDFYIPNAPGAGRPSVDRALSEHLLAYVIVAMGLSEEEIHQKIEEMEGSQTDERANGQLSEESATNKDSCPNSQPSDGCDVESSEVFSPNTTDDIQTGVPEPGQVPTVITYEDLCKSFNKLDSIADETLRKAKEVLSRSQYGETSHLSNWLSYIRIMKDAFRDTLETCRPSEDELANAPELCDSSAIPLLEDDLDTLSAALGKKFAFSNLKNAIDALQVSCKDLIRAIDSVQPTEDAKTFGYRQLKACAKTAPFKSRMRIVERHWKGHALAKDTAQRVASAIIANKEALRKTEERADGKMDESLHLDSLLVQVRSSLKLLLDATRGECQDSKGNSIIRKAMKLLDEAGHFIDTVVEPELETSDKEIRCMIGVLLVSLNSHFCNWADRLRKGCVTHIEILQVSREICYDHVRKAFSDSFKELRKLILEHDTSRDDGQAVGAAPDPCQDNTSHPSKGAPTEQDIQSIEKKISEARESLRALRDAFHSLQLPQILRDSSEPDPIADVINLLDQEAERFETAIKNAKYQEDICICRSLNELCTNLTNIFKSRLERLKGKADVARVTYSVAKKEAASILKERFKKANNSAWKIFENGIREEQDADTFVGLESINQPRLEFHSGMQLTPRARCTLIRRFWNEGKNPLDIAVWVDYIIQTLSDDYGSPEGGMKCCHITEQELHGFFHCLTGIDVSVNSLWSIFRKRLAYTSRQCLKLDQIGEAHPMAQQQKDHIKAAISNADYKTTLILSVDTKAFVVLGRLKHDNGVLMCSPDGSVYTVYDHDYPFKMCEVYKGKSTTLVGEDRMQENAVLRPVGAYCLNDGTGFVSLVLGKDNAESMRALLTKVIKLKKESMPELENVMLLADGGGANIACGIQWLAELDELSKELHLNIECHHYPPGQSRHNPVEHRLWGPISVHWKGRPFLSIEHVMEYIEDTSAMTSGQFITCWFDKKKYKTLSEKKAEGELILSRDEIDKMLEGRIIHDFDEESPMYKWNYRILHEQNTKTTEESIAKEG